MTDATVRRLQAATNIATIFAAILLSTILIHNYTKKKPAQKVESGFAIGSSLPLGVDWKTSRKNLILIMQPDCKFCTESAPFYRDIQNRRKNFQEIKIVAVFPGSLVQSNNYLKKNNVTPDLVVNFSLSELGVRGTPTLVVLDSDGKVRNVWRGLLGSDAEREVFRALEL